MDNKVPAVQMRDITKRFGTVLANDRVWLNIYRGEILALLGENGSGKTTLMNMLSGIYFPDEGTIAIDGKEVVIRSPKDAFDLGIGMIHQHFKLVDVLTAAVPEPDSPTMEVNSFSRISRSMPCRTSSSFSVPI